MHVRVTKNGEIKKECFTFSSDKSNTFNVEIKNEFNAISVYAVYKGEIQSKEYANTFSLNNLKKKVINIYPFWNPLLIYMKKL